MPQNPAPSSLFVSKIVGTNGVTVSPSNGTGIVTVSNDAVGTTNFGSLTATQLTVNGPTAVDTLEVAARGQFTANGASLVSVDFTGLTATSVVGISLAEIGGTVGAVPSVKTVEPGVGFTVSGTASDTSVYNYVVIG